MLVWKALVSGAIGAALFAHMPASADDGARLLSLINAYRASPATCDGNKAAPAVALAPNAALAAVRIGPGTILVSALDQAGYVSKHAEAIGVSGPSDAHAVMALIQDKYCKTLLNPQFTAAGVARNGNDWQIVLAQPLPKLALPDLQVAGKTILDAVNAARAVPRSCGSRRYAAAPALAWDTALADAALVHSRDMANRKRLSHEDSNGQQVGDRASRAGYPWQRIGENIASGQRSPEEAVAGWLASPGHCANIMNSGFTEMGAAYGIHHDTRLGTAYWTQVFGRRR